jgi:predicted DsbA family dithiol-disulfide isomerase/predicted RNA-binding protein with TRAM domain
MAPASTPELSESAKGVDGLVELTVDRLAAGGDGVARADDGRVVFVPGSAPGDRVRVRIVEQRKRFARAEIVSLVEPGPGRAEPRCSVFGRCGGCTWQHLSYASQLDAKVAIVEFSDFQCPFCSRVGPTLTRINQEYPEDVKVVFKHLPLSFHNKAMGAAQAAEAAGKQGKFWEMHDLLFQNQRALSDEKYLEWAGQLSLDVEKFNKDMASAEVKNQIESDKREASKLGVTGTPGFFINGRFLSGARPFDSFKTIIDEEIGAS